MKSHLCPKHCLIEYLNMFNIYISRTRLESFSFYRKPQVLHSIRNLLLEYDVNCKEKCPSSPLPNTIYSP